MISKKSVTITTAIDFRNGAIGFLAGFAVAFTGAIKDAPLEGFKFTKFMRSPVIGTIEAIAMGRILGTSSSKKINPYLLFLSVIGIERLTTELYKLHRAQTPMKFSFGEHGQEKCCTCPS